MMTKWYISVINPDKLLEIVSKKSLKYITIAYRIINKDQHDLL